MLKANSKKIVNTEQIKSVCFANKNTVILSN